MRLSYDAIETLEKYSDGSFSDCVFEMEDKIRRMTDLCYKYAEELDGKH